MRNATRNAPETAAPTIRPEDGIEAFAALDALEALDALDDLAADPSLSLDDLASIIDDAWYQ